MIKWTIDKKFYSEEESEGLLWEYLDICLFLISNDHILNQEEILNSLEFDKNFQ